MIRIDLGTEDLGGGGKGSKNPFKKLLDRLRMRNAGGTSRPMASADPFARSSTGVLTKLSGVGTILVILVALVGAVVPHFAYEQYREFVIKKNEEQKAELESQLAALTREINRLVPFQKELESYETQKKMLRERLDLIQNLISSRGTPVNVLDAVGQSLPTKTWLTSIDFDAKPARPVITLQGQALSNDEVADYLDKLGESVYMNDVVLDSLNFGKGSGIMANIDLKTFQISLYPKGLTSATPRPKPVAPPAPVATPAATVASEGGEASAKGDRDVAAKPSKFKRRPK